MKTKSLMVLALIALFIGMGTSAYATVTITPVISTDALGTDVITTVAPGQRFFVNVQVSDATGIAGAALTITYDASKFQVIQHVPGQPTGTPVVTGTEVNSSVSTGTILDSDVLTAVSDKTGAALGIFRIGKVDTSTTPAKVMISGAAINGATGAGLATGQNKNIFRVLFRAISSATGSGTFTLTASKPTAGGWDGNTAVPALVGAVASTDANFGVFDYTKCPACAFPPIASNLDTANATATITVQGSPAVFAPAAAGQPAKTVPDINDVRYLLYHFKKVTGYQTLSGNADFNHDGVVDINDVRYLLYNYKKVSGYDSLE